MSKDATPGDEEIRHLRSSINDLISLQTLPAIWNGSEPGHIVSTLLEVLVSMLRLNFAYARLSNSINGSPAEFVRLTHRRTPQPQPQEIGRALDCWLTNRSAYTPLTVPNPADEGEVRIVPLRLGLMDEVGVLVAASLRADFPTPTETLLLRVAANQALVALQEARQLHEQKRAAEELERRVADRTARLTTANQALRESEKKYRTLFDSIDEGFCTIEVLFDENDRPIDYRFLEVNPSFEKQTGIQNARGRRMREIAPQHEEHWFKIYGQIALTGEPVRFENQAAQLHRWYDVYAFRVGEPGERKVATLFNDITERKQSQEATRAAKARFEGILAIAEDAIISVNSDQNIVLFNQGGEKVFGYAENEVIGKPLDILLPQRFVHTHRGHIEEFAKSLDVSRSMAQRREVFGRRKDGSEFPAEASISKLASGNEVVFTVILRDITERKKAEEKLRRNETHLAEAQGLSKTGSWVWSAKTEENVFWSKELRRIYGFDPETPIVQYAAARERIHPEDGSFFDETFHQALREERDFEMDHRIVLPNGDVKHIHVVGHPVLNDSGELVEYMGTVLDVTERKRAELEAQAHVWFLESMDRINRAIQGTNDLEEMMSEVLKAVLSIFNCDRAWLVHPCDPQAPAWRAAMEHVRPDFPGAFALGVDLPLDPEVAAVFGRVRDSRGSVCFGPESDDLVPSQLAERFSIRSMIGVAIYPKLDKPYMFGLHQCTHPRVWTLPEQRLFQEVGRRMEDALSALLMFRSLQNSEAKLEEAQRIAHVGHWERDLDTGLITWSNEIFRIYGLAPQECVLNLSQLADLVHPEDRQIMIQAVADAVSGFRRYNAEFRVIRPTGEVRFVHSQGDIFKDESGRPRRHFGTIQDITERKLAEEALRRSESYLAEAQRLSHTGSWAWTPAPDEIKYLSEECYRVLGFDPQVRMQTSETFFQRIHPEDQARTIKAIETATREKAEFEMDYRIVHPGGEIREIHSIGHPVFSPSGDLIEFVGTVIDVTERKRAESALNKAQVELAHVTRITTMGELTASIAHEVNQPLTAVVNNANASLSLLPKGAPGLEEVREALAEIIDDANRASDVIVRIRQLAKRAPIEKSLLDLRDVVQDVLALSRYELAARKVTIRTDLSKDVPSVFGDRVQLQQVLLNLIINGMDAMNQVEESKRALAICGRRETRDGTSEARLSVSDSGVGFKPEEIDRLFEAFYTTKTQGMGMGLAISHSIIEAHGGRLWAEPNQGPGATFSLSLPAAPELPG